MSSDLQYFLDQYSAIRAVFSSPDFKPNSLSAIFESIQALCQYLTAASKLVHTEAESLSLEPTHPLFLLNQTIEELNQQISRLVSFQTTPTSAIVETKDKFFWVTLTSKPSDGSPDYISKRLIKSFYQMAPPAYSATAKAFVIGPNLTLYGLIRFDHRSPYRISAKSSHFRNEIRQETTGILQINPLTVINLTQYQSKRYITHMSDLVEKYEWMEQQGTIIGDEFPRMIEPDSV